MNAELFAAVENPRFSADLNVVSGYKQFLRALESSAEGLALLEGVKTGEDSLEILFRVVSSVDAPVDPQYENLHDVALAAYLWVLSRTDPVIADTAAELVLECSGCWWARKVAEHLMTSRKAKREGLAVSRDGSNDDKARKKMGQEFMDIIASTHKFGTRPPCYRWAWDRSWRTRLRSWLIHHLYCRWWDREPHPAGDRYLRGLEMYRKQGQRNN